VVTVIIKKLSETERPVTIMFYFGITSTTVAAIPAAAVWRTPTLSEIALLMLIGALGATAQVCTIRAYRVGEASAITPFDYSRLLFAGLLGVIFFAEIPDLWTLAGAGIIVASTLYIARREALARVERPMPIRYGGAPLDNAKRD
ncbi:MAG: DMT family transporter, partial [Alphaproteobacteria bacterium]